MLQRQAEIAGKVIRVEQDLTLSHAGTVWDGALTLGYYFAKNPDKANHFLKDKKVLELGSGTGFSGFAASCFHPNSLYLTDLPEYLEILHKNIKINQEMLKDEKVMALPLAWGNQSDIEKTGDIDTILASEIAYDIESIRMFMKTLMIYREKNPKLKIIISYQKYANKDKNLFEVFSKEFGVGNFKEVGWGEMDPDYRDETIGIIYID